MVQPDSVHTSPDGRIRIEYESSEIRMSLWVDVPRIVEVETGKTIFESRSSLWSGEHEWGEGGKFALTIRLYPDGGNSLTLYFDIDEGTVSLGKDGTARPIARAARLAEKEFGSRPPNPLLVPSPPTSAATPYPGGQSVSTLWKIAVGAILILAVALFVGSYWA